MVLTGFVRLSQKTSVVHLFSVFPSTQFLHKKAFQHLSTTVIGRVALVEEAAVVENLCNVADKGLQ